MSTVLPSIVSLTKGEMDEETVGVVELTCLKVSFSDSDGDTSDTAGIGGDKLGSPNTLIIVGTTVVVVGACTVKYGNWVVLLRSGVVDRSEVSGANTNVSKEMTECVSWEENTRPTPV